VRPSPALTVVTPSVFITDKSATATTVVVSLPVLLAVLESFELLAVAEFV
jgi:hypothetical protein